MSQTFYFYDLETSGINPRDARVMQFAGQRTDMDLNPVGEPHNILIKLTDDIVPEPDAILITGITPQMTIQDGVTEAEFLKVFFDEIATPGTIFVGFNTVRFDDEFMRHMLYRNFYDPYEWQWSDGRSRWDILDVVRMTRALRPDGINWPVDSKGAATNRLELLTSMNGLDHENAHDALNDVFATIAVAELIKTKQPKLFDYLLQMRDKKQVAALVESAQPFVYTSGKYSNDYEKTTVVATVTQHPQQPGAAFVFDLRYDPKEYSDMSVKDLVRIWQWQKDKDAKRLPVKTIKYNRCPAIAQLNVLDTKSQERLHLSAEVYRNHFKTLQSVQAAFAEKLHEASTILDKQQQTSLLQNPQDVDARLYDGFIGNADKPKMSVVRAADSHDIAELSVDFQDQRLQELLPLYKARNFYDKLTDADRKSWEAYRYHRLLDGKTNSKLARYFNRLGQLAQSPDMTDAKMYLLEELQLYGQAIMPDIDAE